MAAQFSVNEQFQYVYRACAFKRGTNEERMYWKSVERLQGYSSSRRLSLDTDHKDRSCSNSINKSLFGVEETEPKGGKRKRISKAKSLVQVLPPEFLDHIDSARSYKEAKEAGHEIPLPEQNYKHWVKEGSLHSVKWDVFHGDVRRMQSFVPREKYTLAIADVPYGFQLKDCSHDESSGTTLVYALQGGRDCVVVELDKRQFMYLRSRIYNMKKLPDADSEVTRGHKHSKDVSPPTCDGGASLVEMAVPHTVDEVILLEKDQVLGSAGTGGSEADDGGIGSIDGIEDPEDLDPAEGAEAGEDEVAEDEQSLGEGVRVVLDSLLGE
ncbi:hypothetical protein R1sor_017474 [Riccia sorocarpa]|uniref:Uncharacterized protein n=1 Tax=Riccia sorocarpa TaxID=122646 RepID=A0ABD3I6Z8_9MARC